MKYYGKITDPKDLVTKEYADTKYTMPAGGIPASDIKSGVIPTVPSASSTTPKMDGTASAGTGTTWAKGDHVHPTDTSRQAKITASGLLKGDGNGGISAATAGSDYASPLSVPSQASVGTTGLISFKNSSGTQIFTIQLPLYNGGVV